MQRFSVVIPVLQKKNLEHDWLQYGLSDRDNHLGKHWDFSSKYLMLLNCFFQS